jgi:hypothetical protein
MQKVFAPTLIKYYRNKGWICYFFSLLSGKSKDLEFLANRFLTWLLMTTFFERNNRFLPSVGKTRVCRVFRGQKN